MKKLKEDKLVALAYSSLVVAILSAFSTIVSYTNKNGVSRTFDLLDFLYEAKEFGAFVLREYKGTIYVQYQPFQLFLLIGLGAAAVACAFVGLLRLSKQTDNRLSFVLTLLGLLGTMAPSLTIFICIVALKDQYIGNITCGVYPVVSPLAMVVCIVAATRMRRRNLDARKKLEAAEGLIFRGGDLS